MYRRISKRRLLLGVAALLFAYTSAALTEQRPGLSTYDEVSAFTHSYYQQPRPEMIEHLMSAVPLTALFKERPNSRPGYVGFFSEVFAANPDRLLQWRQHIAKQDQPMRDVLEQALSMNKSGGVNAIDGYSGPLNDMRWGAFFASGHAAHVSKLIEQLRFVDDREDANRFALGAASKWSLASNAQSHGRVRAILEVAQQTSDARTREIIVDLLSKDPARVRQEVLEISKQRWGAARAR